MAEETVTEVAAGTAVRHRTRPDMQGRVRRLIGERAVVTRVRRRNLSCVRIANLEPITDAELAAYFHEQEAEHTRLLELVAGEPYAVVGEGTSDENRRFLLGETS